MKKKKKFIPLDPPPQPPVLPQEPKFVCALTEKSDSTTMTPYRIMRGQNSGDFAFTRYVEDTNSITSDNASSISHFLRQLADVIGSSQGFELGEAQIYVVIKKHVDPRKKWEK